MLTTSVQLCASTSASATRLTLLAPRQNACSTAPKGPDPDALAIAARMNRIRHKILVLSGKGGVGKSTFSSQLAFALAAAGKQVGLLDIDICGPSVPKMLGLEGEEVHQSSTGWSPVYVSDNLGVMSIGFMLSQPDEAVVWRGPRKNGLIKQFLRDVEWGELDYLVVDAPPGTSDEHISITQYLQECGISGAVVVTTPQEVSLADVRKELSFCKKVGLPVIGIVENMSGLQVRLDALNFHNARGENVTADVMRALEKIPDAQGLTASIEVFCSGNGAVQHMASAWGVPFLGAVPFDPALTQAAERGEALAHDAIAASHVKCIVDEVMAICKT